jgi:hypothetical protein
LNSAKVYATEGYAFAVFGIKKNFLKMQEMQKL